MYLFSLMQYSISHHFQLSYLNYLVFNDKNSIEVI